MCGLECVKELKRNKLVHHVPFVVFLVLLNRHVPVMRPLIGTRSFVVVAVRQLELARSAGMMHKMTHLRYGWYFVTVLSPIGDDANGGADGNVRCHRCRQHCQHC